MIDKIVKYIETLFIICGFILLSLALIFKIINNRGVRINGKLINVISEKE